MRARCSSAYVFVFMALLVAAGASEVRAQSVCTGPPYLGTNGPELCVNVSEDSGASLDLRGPSPITINQTIGDYRVNVAIAYAVEATGMAVSIEGTVRRTSAGAGGITIRADGGTNASVPASSGSLELIGDATGPSHVQLGGAAGFRQPGGDVAFESYLVTCDELIVDGGPFECTIDSIPVNPGAVATTNITGFHITNVGDIVDIPSTTLAGEIEGLPSSGRRFTELAQLVPGVTPLEIQAAPIEPGPNPDLMVFYLWSTGVNMNHLGACRVPSPYDGTGMTCQTDIDTGPLFGVNGLCVTAPNEAYAAYTKYVGGNYDIRVARYDGLSWVFESVTPTSSQDFHTASCFQTTHGLFLTAFNNTTSSIDVFKRLGDWQLSGSYNSSFFSGTPGSPFYGAPIGKAASFGSFGTNLLDSAAITVGLSNGTLELGRLTTTTTPPSLVTANLGSADGESSVGLSFSPRYGFVYDLGWQDQQVLRGGFGIFYDHPSQAQTFTLGTIQTGTLIPDFQGIDTAFGPDGHLYVAADRFYDVRIDDTAWPPAVTELWDYPHLFQGGPIKLVYQGDPKFGWVSGPGSLMLSIISIEEIFSDGFETGDTIAW
jgi:hypothetical protein